jgi:hypothetical protein
MVMAAPELQIGARLYPEARMIGEQRVALRGLSWDGYLQILDALPLPIGQ